MANAALLAKLSAVRLLVLGWPGSGKTGALACLVNAGFKLRILAFDKLANVSVLFNYVDPAKLSNIDIITVEDKLRNGQKYMETVGLPVAFNDAMKALQHWEYDQDGKHVDLGASKDWGPDTIVVLDSLTSMGQAAMRRAQAMLNKTPLNGTQQMWGLAMADQDSFIEKLVSNDHRFHVIVLSHLKVISPKDVNTNDENVTKEIKEDVAGLLPARFYPSALGQQLPQQISRHFPITLLAENHVKGHTVTRELHTLPRPELDLKLPANLANAVLPVADGLLTVFKAVTDVGACLDPANNPAPVATVKP
jgi:hypothetical protein